MIRLKKIGHVLLRVSDLERSKQFYTEALGFRVAEEDPDHGGAFLTLGDGFHTIDLSPHPSPESAPLPRPGQMGLIHIAFQVDSYEALREAYVHLQHHSVAILRATNHVNQRSLYFSDPDGNGLEIYYEIPNSLEIFAGGRGDVDERLDVGRPNDPLPAWLLEDWPAAAVVS